MAATLDELARRLTAVEREVENLRALVEGQSNVQTSSLDGIRRLERARREKARLSGIVARVLAEMGIVGEPVEPQELRRMMAEDGIRAEDNLFSRDIVEMREE